MGVVKLTKKEAQIIESFKAGIFNQGEIGKKTGNTNKCIYSFIHKMLKQNIIKRVEIGKYEVLIGDYEIVHYYKINKKGKTAEEKYWDNVIVIENDCWGWKGAVNHDGYGSVTVWNKSKSKAFRANRVSWMIHNGQIPEGYFVCHKCDNPSCTNPDHLFLGTPHDNTVDMVRKGRDPRGERAGGVKLTEDDVMCIRKLHLEGTTPAQIATLFPYVHPGHIYSVLKRKIWKHIP